MSRAGAGQAELEVPVSECQHCGETFEHEHGLDERTYCSRECHYATLESEPQSSVWKQCDEEFTHPPSRDRTFCSLQCKGASNRKQEPSEKSDDPIEPVEVYEALDGHGHRAKTTKILASAGYETEEELRQANPHALLRIDGISTGTVSQLCRNLDYPWVTPFKHGPNPPEDRVEPVSKPTKKPVTTSIERQEEEDDSRDGHDQQAEEEVSRNEGSDVSVEVCPFCNVLVKEKKYAVHVRRCDEA